LQETTESLIKQVQTLTKEQAIKKLFDWRSELNARPNQIAPDGNWTTWLILAGRGFGKTRTGAEWIRERVESGLSKRIALIGKTPADVRDVMIEGESGLINISPPYNMPNYEPSKRRLTWNNGAIAQTFSSYEPDQLRGSQFDTAWADEMASWEYPEETWDNLMFALRLGEKPQVCVTTTPKPLQLLINLRDAQTTVLTKGSSYDNRENLNEQFFDSILSKYKNTRLGMQEIYAEILEESDNAMWKREWLDDSRLTDFPEDLERVVVAIDPAVTSKKTSDETGMIVAGKDSEGKFYVLHDASARYTPSAWSEKAIMLFNQYQCDKIIAEVNNGGQLVEHTLRTQSENVPYKSVHASRGKRTRAEPIASLYEQGKVHHVGNFQRLENQLCNWEATSGEPSPDRLDALVWALTELSGSGNPSIRWL
tara:strand:+ start:1024 stop:2295 length:1272 start_codon:yes stop_codon:yes gene_type:complete